MCASTTDRRGDLGRSHTIRSGRGRRRGGSSGNADAGFPQREPGPHLPRGLFHLADHASRVTTASSAMPAGPPPGDRRHDLVPRRFAAAVEPSSRPRVVSRWPDLDRHRRPRRDRDHRSRTRGQVQRRHPGHQLDPPPGRHRFGRGRHPRSHRDDPRRPPRWVTSSPSPAPWSPIRTSAPATPTRCCSRTRSSLRTEGEESDSSVAVHFRG